MSWEQSPAQAEGERTPFPVPQEQQGQDKHSFTHLHGGLIVLFPEATVQIYRSDLPQTSDTCAAKPKGQTISSSQTELPDKHREPQTVRWMKTGDRNHLRIWALERFN